MKCEVGGLRKGVSFWKCDCWNNGNNDDDYDYCSDSTDSIKFNGCKDDKSIACSDDITYEYLNY